MGGGFADERVAAVRQRGRKGWLAAFRDATLFKVASAWGLRRREAAMLDIADFTANPAAPELGRFGTLAVRYGKAMRSSPPRRRQVATVMPWAAGAVAEYPAQVRPRCGLPGHPALWLTERGGRVLVRQVGERFAACRDAAGLPGFLTPHCLRHSYVSHLEIGRIASDASFGRSRERALPAAQGAALRCGRPEGPPRRCGDLGVRRPSASDATLMRLVSWRGVHHRCPC